MEEKIEQIKVHSDKIAEYDDRMREITTTIENLKSEKSRLEKLRNENIWKLQDVVDIM